MESDRVLFIVDAASLLYKAHDLYGMGSRIDFLKLRERARAIMEEEPSVFIPVVQVFKRVADESDKAPLVSYLTRRGFEVKLHPPTPSSFKGDHRAKETVKDITGRLATGAYNHLIVASAHGDLMKSCSNLSSNHLKVSFLLYGSPVEGVGVGSHFLTSDVIFTPKTGVTL